MNLPEHIKRTFNASINLKTKIAEEVSVILVEAAKTLANALNGGNKILACGNGGSACDAQHFVCELVNRFQIERDGMPAVALTADMATLTAISNDYGYDYIFSKQIKSLGKQGDILLAISTSGNSKNVLLAIEMAHDLGLSVIALTGGDGGRMATLLNENDIEIRVPAKVTPRIQEVHILAIHCLCDLIDRLLFAEKFEEMV